MQVVVTAKNLEAHPNTTGMVLEDVRDTGAGIMLLGSDAELLALVRQMAFHLGQDVSPVDPGPEPICGYCDYYEREGIQTPIHECPAPEPTPEDRLGEILSTLGLDMPVRFDFGYPEKRDVPLVWPEPDRDAPVCQCGTMTRDHAVTCPAHLVES